MCGTPPARLRKVTQGYARLRKVTQGYMLGILAMWSIDDIFMDMFIRDGRQRKKIVAPSGVREP